MSDKSTEPRPKLQRFEELAKRLFGFSKDEAAAIRRRAQEPVRPRKSTQ